MTTKKYLTLEEAAKVLGVSPKELTKIREQGQIRGFADRGTWKFRQEDVDKVKRMRQADSSPDVPLVTDDDEGFGSSVVLSGDEEDELGAQPTIIRGSALDEDLDAGTSDSDVRLILDDSLVNAGDSKLDVSLSFSDSDSDVRLTEEKKKPKAKSPDQSDSDVKLVTQESGSDSALQSDSDVKLVAQDSDSDVRLSDESGPKSDSDVKIYDGDDSGRIPSDSSLSDVKIMDLDKTTVGGESDLLYSGTESGVLEDQEGSGSTSVFADDSGIALEGASDSGISLAADEDSGISLVADDEDGITLAEDSGISIAAAGSSTSRADSDSEETINMLAADSSSEMEATSFDVPSSTGDSEFDLDAGDSSHDTSVILFDDDEDDDFAPAKPRRTGASDDAVAVEEAELEVDGDVFDVDEPDELDVFDAGDEAFEDSFQTGASHADFSTSSAIGRGAVAAPEAEWTKVDFAGVALSTLVTVICAVVSFDLVRSMWHWGEPSPVAGPILDALAGLF
ncbi:MAG: helix-turn-helix domain-containing protein [Planctomycetaceae bacterium]